MIVYAAAITVLFDVLDFSFISPPWTSIALVGTAVAFVIVFQNESAYGGMWKARKIWEGIVNTSKTWGMKTIAMVTTNKMESPVSEEAAFRENKTIINIHVGRITALRYRITSLEN